MQALKPFPILVFSDKCKSSTFIISILSNFKYNKHHYSKTFNFIVDKQYYFFLLGSLI